MKQLKKIVVSILMAAAMVAGFGNTTEAISGWYYDPSDAIPSWQGQAGYGGGNSTLHWLVAGEASTTRIIETKVKLYYPTRSGNVIIIGGNFCLGTTAPDPIDDKYDTQSIPSGAAVTNFTVSGAGSTVVQGFARYAVGCNDNNATNNKTIDVSPYLQYDSSVGMWSATFHATHRKIGSGNCAAGGACDGVENYFRLGSTTSGAIITHSGGDITGYSTSMNAKTNPGVHTNYHVKFGSDCTVTGPRTASISFYDLDNGPDIPIQPQALYIEIHRVNADGSLTLLSSRTPPKGSSQYFTMSFTASPGGRYEMRVNRAYSGNLIQFSVPFSGIYYNSPCNGTPSLDPSVSISPNTAGISDTVTGKLSFRNGGKSTITNVNYWYEMVAYNGGNRVASLARPSAPNRWNTGALSPGQTANIPDWSIDWTEVIRNGTRNMAGTVDELIYKTDKVCIQIRDSQIALTPSGAISPNFVQDCTTVAKAPALTVKGGDLRVGGSFPGVSGTACMVPRGLTSNRVPYGVLGYESYDKTRSSLGEYATYTPGAISGYGSGGLAYDSPVKAWNHLLFGTKGFVDMAQYADNGLFLGPSGVGTGTTSYCLANLANMYYAGPNTTPIGTNVGITNSSPKASTNYNFTGSNGTLNLSAAAGTHFNPGERAVIKVTQTQANNVGNKIIIRGPIRYATSGYTSIAQLPQFVLIADGKIDIQFDGSPGISKFEVNGLYSTKGNVYTCDGQSGEAGLTWSGQCSTPLVVNGAVIAAGRVLPFRTAGFDKKNDTNTYAEEFNLTPETLLGDYARGASSSNLSVDYVTEMPARY